MPLQISWDGINTVRNLLYTKNTDHYTTICDHLCINHPFTAKCTFWVRPKITAKSAQDRYSVMAIGVIYGVLATLCRSTMLRLRIVSPGVTPLLPFTDKKCGDVNRTCKRQQSAVKNA